MLSNRPLLPHRADEALFVELPPHRQLFESAARGRNTLVLGLSGSGKTTTLRMLELRRRQAEQPTAFVSLARADSVGQAVVATYRAAVEERWVEPADEAVERALRPEDPYAANALLRRLARAPAEAAMLVDDVNAEVGHELFGRLRDELWQLPLIWFVAAGSDEAAGLAQPPADAFFDRRIHLTPLSGDEQGELLRRRNTTEVKVGRPAYPREVIAFAREVIDTSLDPNDLAQAEAQRLLAAEHAAGRAGAMVVTEMNGMGPVSASDHELLRRLGWTRPRAVDVLHRLEEAGVVRSSTERRATPGRPRKLYELVPASEILGGRR